MKNRTEMNILVPGDDSLRFRCISANFGELALKMEDAPAGFRMELESGSRVSNRNIYNSDCTTFDTPVVSRVIYE